MVKFTLLKLRKIFIIVASFLIISFVRGQDNYSIQKVEAGYIYNFLKEITWPNQAQIRTFEVVIYGSAESSADYYLFSKLKQLEKRNVLVKGRPVNVLFITDLDRLFELKPQVLYVSQEHDSQIRQIFFHFYQEPVLLITFQTSSPLFTMIDFQVSEGHLVFKINMDNFKAAGFKAKEDILIIGGNSYLAYEIFREKIEQLKASKQKLDSLLKKLDSLQQEIEKQEKLFLYQRKFYMEELKRRERQIEMAKHKSDSLMALIKKEESLLGRKSAELRGYLTQINSLKKKIAEKTAISKQISEQIEKNRQIIEQQKKYIEGFKTRVERQQKSIFSLHVIIAFLILLLIFIVGNYFFIRRFIRQLRQKNREVEAQAEELKQINYQLEKLSIVASKTDNVILIMDVDGNIEWVNDALEKKFKLSKNNFIGRNLREVSSLGAHRIGKYLERTKRDKVSIVYESPFRTGDGKIIWTQTTLTPILNAQGEVERIIAIDTDITKLKTAQEQIEEQNRELLRQQKLLLEQNKRIDEYNRQVQSSLEYAKLIQMSVLPRDEEIKWFVKDYFLIYRPLSIVSGDFYWLGYDLSNRNEFYVAVADCTGHGVPGAFMSLISQRLLEEAVYMKGKKLPNDILNEIEHEVTHLLKSQSDDSTLSGLDIILLRLEKIQDDRYRILFSGAKRPLVVYFPGAKDLEVFNTDRKSIGGINFSGDLNSGFELYELQVPVGTRIYMFTDGYTDQFCSLYNKRIGTKRFLELLNQIKTLPMHEQKSLLENYLYQCMKDEFQRDDITVWAIEI